MSLPALSVPFEDEDHTAILRLVRRPAVCPLIRQIWKVQGMPPTDAFDPVVSEAWLERWSLEAQRDLPEQRPSGWVLEASPEVFLYICGAPVGCKIALRAGPGLVRVLPFTLALEGASAGFPASTAHAYIALRSGRGRAKSVRLETRGSRIDACSGMSVYRMPSASAQEAADFHLRLRAEVVRAERGLSKVFTSRHAWPAVLRRDVVESREGSAAMRALISRLASWARAEGAPAQISVRYLRPGQDGSASALILDVSGLEGILDEGIKRRIIAGFELAKQRLWPDGWMKGIGPERSSKRLVEGLAPKLSSLGREAISHHDRVWIAGLIAEAVEAKAV